MVSNYSGGGQHALGIAVGITMLVILLAGGAGATELTIDDRSVVNYSEMLQVDNATSSENIPINQEGADSDADGISDYDEINGFTWNNITYYTDPFQRSTDFDPYNDYQEITTINMDPTVLSPGRHPLVPSYPDLKVDIGKITVNTLTKITSTEAKESYSTWDINTLTVDVTKENWGANTEAKVGWSWKEGIYAYAKANAYYDYLHLLTTISTGTTSGWNKEEWSMATAVDTDKAARLKYFLKIRNNGTDTAKNVQLKFNVKIGENVITTITTGKIANRIDPNTAYPGDTYFVIDKDYFGNDITVTLNELKSIELGAPLTIEILEIYAEVPWENEQYRDWSDYKASIDRTSARIVLDTGRGVKEYRVFSGIRYPAFGYPYYFMNVTLENATLYTLGGEQKDDGVYIGGEKVEDWRFGFDNSTFTEVVKHLNKTNGSLLSIPMRQGWTVVMKPPDKEPPKIHWAVYTKDLKGIVASVSDNENIENVTAYVKIGNTYQNLLLKDDDKDLVYNATLPEKIMDVYDGYVRASDGTFISKLKILPIPDIIVDDDLEDDPKNHTWNTIQEGIDNANESDIIYVCKGTYKENIAIYKPLTLIGEDNNNTIIDGGNKGDAVYVKANNVQISEFKIINGKSEDSEVVEIRGEVANGSFTWTPDNFGGFWYDLDSDAGNETLQAVVTGRDIYNGNLIYTTPPQEVSFGCSGFGKYEVIGFMGEKYFAGYTANTTPPNPTVSVGAKSTFAQGQLHKVLIDDDTKRTLSVGSTLPLKDGYVLKAKDIDVNAKRILLSLLKDGTEIDATPISPGKTYVFTKKVGNVSDLPLIMVRLDSVFIGKETQAAFLKGMFQISEVFVSIKTGNRYGMMEVVSVSKDKIVMQNDYSIYLSKDTTVDIAGNLKFKVADSDTLRFYPLVEHTVPGTYEIKGKVARGTKAQTWDAYSFAGFYYDMNEDIKTEKLSISGISGRTIGKGNITYQTYSAPKYFNVYKYKGILINGQANYSVIGWEGEQYAAVNGKANKIAKIYKEQGAASSDKKTLTIGETWDMGNGYMLSGQLINVNASPRWARLILSKDGIILENKTVQQGEVYVYSVSIGNETNVPVFVTYVDSIFAGATTNMVQVRYTWLMSQDVVEIKNGGRYGALEVVNATSEKLILKNGNTLSLSQGSTIDIIRDILFKVADSTELRYYPVATKIIPSWEGASGIKLDESENSVISDVNIINSSVGIRLYSAKDNQLVKNSVSADYIGIDLTDSFQNVLSNNTILSKVYGVKPEGYDKIHFNNSIDTSNKLNGKPVYYYFNEKNIALDGIDTNHLTLAYSTGFKIRNSIIGGDGINLYYSESNIISNDTFGGAGLNSNGYEEFSGIWSYKTTDHYNLTCSNYGRYNESLFGETVGFSDTQNKQYVEKTLIQATLPVPGPIGGGGGGGGKETRINLYYSYYNNITSNTLLSIVLDNSHSNIVTNNNASINLYNSGNNVIDSNNAFNNSIGIYLSDSSNNSLSDNNVLNNNFAGIYLLSSNNNTLSGNTASNNHNAVWLSDSSNNILSGNTANLNNGVGIVLLYYSNSNTLIGNNVSNNDIGIFLVYSSNNTLTNTNVNSNNGLNGVGIYLDQSNNNTLNANYISNNNNGICLFFDFSNNNKIFHNNLINNTNQAYDNSGGNSWDNSYPGGGNYWSDYTGADNFRGVDQNLSGSDGIGDIPYNISGTAKSKDRYPFKNQSGWISSEPLVADCGPDKLKCENVGSPVQFDGSSSTGAIVSYAWDFGDGTAGTGMAPKHTYTSYKWNGTAYLPFIANLTVIDNSGLTNSTSQKVVIWITGDSTGDGKVNILDASVVGLKWGTNDPCADLNNDGKVNILDASIIGLNWGKSA